MTAVTEREAYVALNAMNGVGPVTARALREAFGSLAAALEAGREALLAVPGVGPETARRIREGARALELGGELAAAGEAGARLVTPLDGEYPEPLSRIYDPPLALYVRGTLEKRDRHAIAVVGSRRTTLYGMETAERLAYQLASAGFTVVSGLARGIDTAAHRGALKAKGRTIGVLGGGLAEFYPPENRELADRMAESGAVLSEFPMQRVPDKTTFPMRNRIVSGLSMGVLVVEAGLQSGAIITAHEALEQGRAVFAVPGRIDSAASKGCHQLIKAGARLVESVDDVLEEFGDLFRERPGAGETPGAAAAAAPRPAPSLSGDEEALMVRIREEERIDIDTLTRAAGLPSARVSVALIGLEMKRLVRMRPGRIVEIVA